MRSSDWSSDVCASDLLASERDRLRAHAAQVLGVDPGSDVVSLLRTHTGVPSRLVDQLREALAGLGVRPVGVALDEAARAWLAEHGPTSGPAEGDAGAARAERLAEIRSEEHTSELQSIMRTPYAVFFFTKQQQQ